MKKTSGVTLAALALSTIVSTAANAEVTCQAAFGNEKPVALKKEGEFGEFLVAQTAGWAAGDVGLQVKVSKSVSMGDGAMPADFYMRTKEFQRFTGGGSDVTIPVFVVHQLHRFVKPGQTEVVQAGESLREIHLTCQKN